ncbi:C-type lectin domain family 5 member A isoform X1 [Erinaceus europaeus]|uniref:C-type lectin domain family 5 member A isoform X1 n=1 Tax=Erinaceus europaeus TaxID=9365 RepID=A0ABM3XV67_ERIEU|nr:C-type lectin domain family 5 member A isoform X1 [Erinaceus europaeus]
MNWHLVTSVFVVVVLKIVGMTFFLFYFPQIFGENNDGFIPTGSYGTVPQIFGTTNMGFVPTQSYNGTACSKGWDFYQGKCFFLSTDELSWIKSKNYCEAQGSSLAIINRPEELKFLQDIIGAEKYFIGLTYKSTEKKWLWINNRLFNGNITNQHPEFGCVTIGLTNTYDAASCDISYRWICEKRAE